MLKNIPISEQECAAAVFDCVPVVMRTIRGQMRSHRPGGLTVPQFRTLIFVARHEGASLSQVCEHTGVSPASMSRLVEGLVVRGLVRRQMCKEDRRRIKLGVTQKGHSALQRARSQTQAGISQILSRLDPAERNTVESAMRSLLRVFAGVDETPPAKKGR